MKLFKRKTNQLVYITDEIEQAIENFKNREKFKKNAFAGYCIRHLSSNMEKIRDSMISKMNDPRYIHSDVYLIKEIFGDIKFDDLFSLKGDANDNPFAEYLSKNKLTMAINEKHEFVMFAYGCHAYFHSCWLKFAGYDY